MSLSRNRRVLISVMLLKIRSLKSIRASEGSLNLTSSQSEEKRLKVNSKRINPCFKMKIPSLQASFLSSILVLERSRLMSSLSLMMLFKAKSLSLFTSFKNKLFLFLLGPMRTTFLKATKRDLYGKTSLNE